MNMILLKLCLHFILINATDMQPIKNVFGYR